MDGSSGSGKSIPIGRGESFSKTGRAVTSLRMAWPLLPEQVVRSHPVAVSGVCHKYGGLSSRLQQ